MGACLIAGRLRPVPNKSRSNTTAGAKKHVMGYPTPPIPDSNAQDQATELPPGQGTLELVSWVPAVAM